MPLKILIVEDVFVEADHLGIILTKAGYVVTGVARSVEQALNAVKKERPDMVMLDIFLKGHLTGIHLAGMLARQNIPFIYLSANSNPSTLEAAKQTNPYGFLVKPFREKDILIALDIAAYRHRQTRDHLERQERWLGSLLSGIIKDMASGEQKLLLLARGLQQSIPFDRIVIHLDSTERGKICHCFERTGLDEYKRVDGPASGEISGPPGDGTGEVVLRGSMLSLLFRDEPGRSSGLIFLSRTEDVFTNEHADLVRSFKWPLTMVIRDIRDGSGGVRTPVAGPADSGRYNETEIQDIVGRSAKLLQVLDLVRQVAPYMSTVLISGETGVGKEGVAGAIHRLSDRRDKPLIKVNCAAIPTSLCESELFGHERGAFTDATFKRIGKFEQAQGGTLFLDEIGELPLAAQGKLLRVLQEKEIERVGGAKPIKIDVRIIAATNRDLYDEVAKGRFRMDLYYRIHVFPIYIPPLRQRKEDIPLLAEHFLQASAVAAGGTAKSLSQNALQRLLAYSWPGNIRELQHVLERHLVTLRGEMIDHVDLPGEPFKDSATRTRDGTPPPDYVAPDNVASDNVVSDYVAPAPEGAPPDIARPGEPPEKDAILAALKQCNGKVSGKGGAAELLGVNPNTLSSRLRKLGIRLKHIIK